MYGYDMIIDLNIGIDINKESVTYISQDYIFKYIETISMETYIMI